IYFPTDPDQYSLAQSLGPCTLFSQRLETFHTQSLSNREFEIPPTSLDSDPLLAVSDVVGHFDPSSSHHGRFSAQHGLQTLDGHDLRLYGPGWWCGGGTPEWLLDYRPGPFSRNSV
uniref:Uncharacterized protein n=1 Tax=Mus spicilegus TaxID=10103 RepID=A0A8C6N3E1_MUSSI